MEEKATQFSLPSLAGKLVMLASGSPRRRQLLSDLAIDFTLAPTLEIEETYPDGLATEEVAPYLSKLKARAYRSILDENEIVITADTVVVNEGKVLGKPKDKDEAKMMLRSLSGHSHKVITGVTIMSTDKETTFSAETEVEFASLTEDEIDFYVDHFNPVDKAGAYGIQEWIGCIGVKSIKGSFYNVMGLPLHRLFDELKRF